ncbi:polymorphic toxin-type HINT domain-containing protein [Paenibacillus sp. L3-i20]|uniref:polymorphic toxin-type HINT domain-containing protein n=1 Tax=Paenibacillus sp. L3-i20 TaxID=2905833 RepID=UPI001EE13C07|nr:polymorphic toxin-type HINT domain-containing protein [Paenibacillus sp. L3-i20]GKU75957.1 hypothetical protein L3i20_v203540 [Paenibacillus sp. L3-i20]
MLFERTEAGVKTRYYYDGPNVIAEGIVDSNGKVTFKARYVRGHQLAARQDAAGQAYYLHNGHGDVIELRGSSGNNALNTYTYDLWGNTLTATEQVSNIFRYSGEPWDSTTQLQYLRARWYDPSLGRFINKDTYEGDLGNPLSQNLYTYVYNNPLKYVDPSGNVPVETILDFLSAGHSTYKMYKEPSWENAGNLAWDVVSVFVPYAPGSYVGKATKAVTKPAVKTTVKYAPKNNADEIRMEKQNARSQKFSCNCFTAGTKVQTDEGEKPIEEIEVGDKVLSKNEETGEVEYKEVVKLFQKQADEIYYVRIGDEVIETTGLHPFWLDEKGWTLVQDLKVGDLLVSSDGTKLAIDKIEKAPRQATVYNFMVADYHSYFVSNLGIWVHNCTILTSGKNFKSHFLDHKKLLENALGTKYQKYNDETSSRFLSDLGSMIDDGKVKFVGNATLQKGGEVYKVYRGNGLTMTTKQNGEWHTLLESGKGMDLKFLFE